MTKSIIVTVTALSIGLASSLSATPRSKQIGTPNSGKTLENCHTTQSGGSGADHGHLKTGPKSKRIGG